MDVFTYRLTVRNSNKLATEKKIKRSRNYFFIYFLSCFYGEETKSQTIADSRKGSQIGAEQGRAGSNSPSSGLIGFVDFSS